MRAVSRGRDTSASKTPRSASHKDSESSGKKEEGRPPSRERASSRDKADSRSKSGSATKKNATTSFYSPIPDGPRIWIKKWVDYSNKYGIGYILSNGSAGVYFNDNTKIICNKEGTGFQYIERIDDKEEEKMTEYLFANVLAELTKKNTILQHFRKHLRFDEKFECFESPLTYVKKWITTSHAMIFRLSNKIVQVFFTDRTELMLSSVSKIVVYINKRGDIFSYQLANALDSHNKEMTKRLKYTKDILTNMLNYAPSKAKETG